ncbi:MAG: DeoR/GlpR family DNA-binding transcription regulator [Haliscomenobacter sp.]|jgi:DeoR/GlpR family transcriptional regulator of sugar metabolism|uniref:DeoR/GlpR family DNA-binding transcription regulator n=1 Tax=Haliscomenobacter sp. TaxID=2717303 RepID=UPI0029B58BA4|nr:DeoR/GlpR family DNA-binding transcription regulator [Haliscomenobacter sp.]MDX2072432.1 DeoR/GlpR family DNA-binding transcription regulator [Haliscomenobacter sp.]
MLKKERQALILREVNIHNKVVLTDLSIKLDVSEDTVRRDLQELADAGKVIKVRGGALSKSYHVYSYKENEIYAYQEKTIIARKAISLLREGMLVLISGGSTNLEIARILPPDLKVTFVTMSLTTAMQLLEHQGSETIFIGGHLSSAAGIAVGGEVVRTLKDIKPDICLMGVNGIDAIDGMTESDWEVVTIKKVMMESSKKVVALSIAEKLDSTQKIRVCGLEELDVLITELDPEHQKLNPYRNLGFEIM